MDSEQRILWRMRSGLLVSWALAFTVTAFLGFVGFILLQRNLSWQPPPDLIHVVLGGGLALLGTGVVVGLWMWVLRVTLVSRRYGDAELELTNVPTQLGGRLQGKIRAAATLAGDEAVNLVLQCWGSRSGGGDSGGETWLRWDSETLLAAEEVEQANGSLSVRFDLEIPAEQPPTGTTEGRWEIRWALAMNLEPNTGYGPTFDIPVEKSDGGRQETAETRDTSKQSSLNVRHVISADGDGSRDESTPPARPLHARVRVEPDLEGGMRITLPRSRMSTFLNVWCLLTLPLWVILPILGLAELKGVESPPVIAYLIQLGLAFGGALVFNGLPMLGQAFVNYGFQVGPDGVVVKRLLRRKRFPAGHFARSEATGSSYDKWMVSLERSGTGFFGGLVVAIVTTESEAHWLVAELSRALHQPA